MTEIRFLKFLFPDDNYRLSLHLLFTTRVLLQVYSKGRLGTLVPL